MDELEQQLRSWAAEEVAGTSAVTVQEAIDRATSDGADIRAHRDRRPRMLAVAAVVLLAVGLAVAGTWGARSRDDDRTGVTTDTSAPAPSTTVPPRPLVTAEGDPETDTFMTCMVDLGYAPSLWRVAEELPEGGTAARVRWGRGDRQRPDFDADEARCEFNARALVDRTAPTFSAWEIPQGGPSQPPEAAVHDGVVPALAARTLSERAVPLAWFDTTEGTWVIARPPDSAEYGEVLLIDTGSIVRAYPLPGLTPTWIHATPEAVYAGRVGDGGLPDSAIIRIDRKTLDSEVVILPAGEPPDVRLPESSRIAPAGTGIGSLVQVDPEASGTLAYSTTGVTVIDLPAIEELFRS